MYISELWMNTCCRPAVWCFHYGHLQHIVWTSFFTLITWRNHHERKQDTSGHDWGVSRGILTLYVQIHTLGLTRLGSDPRAWHIAFLFALSHGNNSPANKLEMNFVTPRPIPWFRQLGDWIAMGYFKAYLPLFCFRCILRPVPRVS